MRQFIEELKPLLDLAEKHNSFLAIENHGDALLNSLDSFKAFVETNTLAAFGNRPGPLPHPGRPRPRWKKLSESAAASCSSSTPGNTSPI